MSSHWETVDATVGIHIARYHFNKNPINTIVIALSEGGLLVIGPSIDTSEAAFAELDGLGRVVAIASPGPFHHLGMPAWQARYPEAKLYASPSGVDRIPKQHKGAGLKLHLTSELQSLLPDHVLVCDAPAMKHADLHVVIKGAEGENTWISNEVLCNSPELPASPVFAFLFKITGSGPGLAVNSLACKLIGAKKKPLGEFFRAQLDEHPPTRLIPSHGDVLEGSDVAARLRALIDAKL